MYDVNNDSIKVLEGQTLTKVTGLEKGSDAVTFETSEGKRFRLLHRSDCCESVSVEDITGDLSGLVDTPILSAEESTSAENPEGFVPTYGFQDSFTWTFYRITTIKGLVVIRWYGESNGYYSESVDFEELKEGQV